MSSSIRTPKISLEIVSQTATQANALACLLDAIPFMPKAERCSHLSIGIAMADSVAIRLATLVGGEDA